MRTSKKLSINNEKFHKSWDFLTYEILLAKFFLSREKYNSRSIWNFTVFFTSYISNSYIVIILSLQSASLYISTILSRIMKWNAMELFIKGDAGDDDLGIFRKCTSKWFCVLFHYFPTRLGLIMSYQFLQGLSKWPWRIVTKNHKDNMFGSPEWNYFELFFKLPSSSFPS